MSVPIYSDLTLYRRLMGEARPYWRHLAVLALLNLFQVPLVLLQPLSLKIVVDNVLGSQPLPGFVEIVLPTTSRSWQGVLAFALVLGLSVTLLEKLRGFASWVLTVRTNEGIATEFKAKLFHHLQRLSLTYHDTVGTADSMYRVDRDAEAIKKITSGLTPYLVAFATLIGMLYVTATMDWQLALVALAGSPIAMLLIAIQRRHVRERWNAVFEHQSRALSVVQEVLSAVRVVKAFGREQREERRFTQHSQQGVKGQVTAAVYEAGLDAAISLLFSVSAVGALLVGVWHIRDGRLALGELLVVLTYVGNLYGPLDMLSRFTSDLQSSFAAAARVCTVLDEEPEIVDRPNARALPRARGAVTFRDVSFSYGAAGPVLHHLSFDIPSGVRVGIFGRTGAGKTTLVNLLTRFYDPNDGQILLDGVDLPEYRIADLRAQFALVLQEPILFSTSIAENIAYARPHATVDEIVAAARAANADAFISALPEGYATPVGERGMRLSGGERQRISLARAFLKDAPILILDEPTSSVDVLTEAQIMEAMQRLMEGRTAFLIAHRLSTLDICDVRLELDHGRLISFVHDGASRPRASGAQA